jgi:hypothetical protein
MNKLVQRPGDLRIWTILGSIHFCDLWPEHSFYGKCFRVVSHTLQIGIIKMGAYKNLLDSLSLTFRQVAFLFGTVFPSAKLIALFHEPTTLFST